MARQRSVLLLVLVLVIAAVTILIKVPIPLGLDLRGGTQLTLQAQPTEAVPEITPEKLEAVRSVVERRINGLGVSESVVQTIGRDQLLVQLPGVSDPAQAERVLGGTAQLDFREQQAGSEQQIPIEYQLRQQALVELAQAEQSGDQAAIDKAQKELDKRNEAIASLFQKTELTGEKLSNAYAAPVNGNYWEVGLEFNNQGASEFAALTKSVAGTGRSLGIFLDNELLSAPTVSVQYAETGITGGRASITGGFTTEEANDLALQLRSGALPVPVKILENRTVGATLGRDSIQSSIYAGLAGLALVLIFMAVYYRLPGIVADISLIIYSILTLAIFSLLGVTLTLPGIAGFILSIGMAVDANVLIFERTREELRDGKTLYRSVESGFYRAFSSILDSNVTTLISCAALFWLGTGLVKGFALTLALGVVVSMFTALTCSRTFLLTVLGFPTLRRPQYFCPKLPKATQSKAIS
ncbi:MULTISPECIES: protein translocase subunit SecD [unclassified Leptolyngbya]|uniref:protein translocase subunit SecD n=1 Tax=unclassified Leptolyngbya TaxID=2650499 RepID=UPI0016846DD6|nr:MULTISPECIES: protein translocase subunit SecD [unclassified Leptolyngbya]MBD1912010.1 protein translocase subunit SecD [Leptolyngbya sp. FACHB-8]MBD2155380.1 protein translocase subunit SecD [Leptolyngbya sp. FACHB-16]